MIFKNLKFWLLLGILLPLTAFSQIKQTDNIWKCLGPFGVPGGNKYATGVGMLTSIYTDKNNLDRIYIGTNVGGFWKTEDGGKNWICKTNNLLGAGSSFYVDKNNFEKVWITTGVHASYGTMLNHKGLGMGIYKTENGGDSWQKIPISEEDDRLELQAISVDKNNSDIIYVASIEKLFFTKDGGKTWKNSGLRLNNAYILQIQQTDSSFFYIAGRNTFYKISKDMEHFENLAPKLCDTSVSYRISIDFKKDTLYALLYSDKEKRNNKLLRSADFGKTWQLVKKKSFSGRYYVSILKVSPDNTIYAGGINLYKKSPTDKRFIPIRRNIHPDIRCLFFPDKENSNLVYVGTDGGIAKSINGGLKWENITGNLSTASCMALAITEENPELILSGLVDCGTIMKTDSTKWKTIYGGDGGTPLIDYSNDSNVFITSNKTVKRYYFTKNRRRFSSLKAFRNTSTYDSKFIQHPVVPDIIFAGRYYLAEFSKFGDSLIGIYNKRTPSGRISAVAVSKSYTNAVYWAKKSYNENVSTLWLTIGGAKGDYYNIGKSLGKLDKENYVSDIYVSSKRYQKLYISLVGNRAKKKIYYSRNAGGTWRNISYNLPNYSFNTIIVDEETKNIYAGSDIGIYILRKGEKEWQRFGNLPVVIVSDLKINKKTRELYTSTYGRGIWKTPLEE